jgi:hypothetical protein
MLNNIMLDLETMGTANDAAIVSIGAVAFDHTNIRSEYYVQVNLRSSAAAGLAIDADTVLWWMEQEQAARQALTSSAKDDTLFRALSGFSSWYAAINGGLVWGNGATFDNVILRNAYKAVDLEPPWKYWQDRCYRTIRDVFPVGFQPPVFEGVKHNALDGAAVQAKILIASGVLK